MSDETEQTAKALQNCAKSVDTWLASGANENKIPRAQIAALSAWAKESCQAALASQPKPAPVLLTDDERLDAARCAGIGPGQISYATLIQIVSFARAIESAVLRKNNLGG